MENCRRLFRIFNAAFGILCLALLGLCMYNWQYNAPAALFVGMLLAAALGALFKGLGPLAEKLNPRRFAAVFWGLAAAYLAALLLLGNLMAEALISDMGVVYDTLREFLAAGHPVENNDYYIICNNNLGLALVLYAWYALLGRFGVLPEGDAGIRAGICLNALAIFAAVVLFSYAAALATGKRSARLGFLALAAGFAPLYLWTPYFYSDTLCLPFMALAVLLYFCYCKRPHWIFCAGMGAALFFGYAVKGSAAILLVAGVLAALLARRVPLRRATAGALALAVTFGGLTAGYRAWQRNYLDWSNEDAVALPTELWLCYGSHGSGNYNDEDAQLCKQAATLAQRRQLMRAAIVQNYQSRTLAGNIAFAARKAAHTWGDGEYGASEYVSTPLHVNFTSLFTVEGQPGHMPLKYYCQAWQYMLLLLAALGALLAAVRGGAPDAGSFLRVGLFGAMLFFSFWETKARYALHFSPFLLLLAVLALDALPAKSLLPRKKEAAHP